MIFRTPVCQVSNYTVGISCIFGFVRTPGQAFLCRWASSQGCSRRQEIYIIEENQGATSSKCVAKKGSTRALSNPPRYSNEIFYQKESSTHHTRPRFAGAWVGARSSLREPSEAVSGEDHKATTSLSTLRPSRVDPAFSPDPTCRSPQRLRWVTQARGGVSG